MKNVISAFIVSICIFVGGFGAAILKKDIGADAIPESADGNGTDAAEWSEGDKDYDVGSEGDTSKRANYAENGDYEYFSFSREFVVPLMNNGAVESLVLLNLNLEVTPNTSSELFSIEPKLRDNVMSTLITLSNDGITLAEPTRVDSYETIRSLVLANLKDSVSEDIQNVLIVDIAKQQI
ncbi:MAG: hypothetical protein AAF683_00920 [Pseudomonadota bacterium]